MPNNTKYDALEVTPPRLPYDISTSALAFEEPRLVDGLNVYTAVGGGIRKRPGFQVDASRDITASASGVWPVWVKTLQTGLLIISAYNVASGLFELIADAGVGYNYKITLRDMDKSVYPHEMVEIGSKAYVKGFPASGDKYGSVIVYGGVPNIVVEPWGATPPTTPARIKGSVTKLSGAILAGAGSLVVTANYGTMPSTPFTIYVGDEEMSVTGTAGTTWTVTRGINGTADVAHADKELVFHKPWNASAHQVDVTVGWGYSYAYKSITGQVSSRAPFETNPDNMPSFTGRFIDKKPIVQLVGLADTTNYPKIVVFRTTDGGGIPYVLEEINNPGAGTFDYIDDSLVSGAGSEDPLPDEQLDRNDYAPTLTSNSPPIPVVEPGIIGTTAPQRCTPIAFYAGRVWYGLGRILVASANEELETGVPEESFDSSDGGVKFRFREELVNVAAITNALYVFTEQRVYIIRGNSKETFEVEILYENVGAKPMTPRAVLSLKDKVAFITNHNKLALTQGEQTTEPLYISEAISPKMDVLPLKAQFDNTTFGFPCELLYYAEGERDWLVLHSYFRRNDGIGGVRQQLIYDLALSRKENRHFWHPPWQIGSSYGARFPSNGGVVNTGPMWTSKNFFTGNPALKIATQGGGWRENTILLPENEFTPGAGPAGVDFFYNPASSFPEYVPYDWSFTPALMRLPAGNHVNALREPTLAPNVAYIEVYLQKQTFTPTDVPSLAVYRDAIPGSATPEFTPVADILPRSRLPEGYIVQQYQVGKNAEFVTFRCGTDGSYSMVNILGFAIVFDPGGGDG